MIIGGNRSSAIGEWFITSVLHIFDRGYFNIGTRGKVRNVTRYGYDLEDSYGLNDPPKMVHRSTALKLKHHDIDFQIKILEDEFDTLVNG